LPSYAYISNGKKHESNYARKFPLAAGSIITMDKGYTDYKLYSFWTAKDIYFVTRLKTNASYKVLEEREVPQNRNILSDEIIKLTGYKARKECRYLLRRVVVWDAEKQRKITLLTNHYKFGATTISAIYKDRWQIGVHINQSMKVRPRIKDSDLVAGEAPWRETKMVKPSDNILIMKDERNSRPQRTVNADVASLHASPVAETVDNARRQQELPEKSLTQEFSPAGYQRWHGVKVYVETGEALGIRRRNPVEEANPITLNGKWMSRYQGGGLGRSTDDRCAAKRARRKGPRLMRTPMFICETGVR